MARKRIIDPEFWSDEEIGFWSYEARLLYIGTWNFADDSGRLKAHDALLKCQIFPYDIKIDIALLKKEIATKIQWYEVDGSQYGFIHNFNKYQRIDRPTESKLPAPPPLEEPIRRGLDEYSTNTRRTLAANTTEVKLREVKLREGGCYDFEFIWTRYPRALGKKDAERHFRASVKTDQDWKDINTALDNYLRSDTVTKDGGKYIMHGSTWFNNWRDYLDVKAATGKSPALLALEQEMKQ